MSFLNNSNMETKEMKTTTDAAEKFDAERIINENTAETVKTVLEHMNAEIERLKKDNDLLRDLRNYEMDARLKTEKRLQAVKALLETF